MEVELVELRVARYAIPPMAAIRITTITIRATALDMAVTLLGGWIRSKFRSQSERSVGRYKSISESYVRTNLFD